MTMDCCCCCDPYMPIVRQIRIDLAHNVERRWRRQSRSSCRSKKRPIIPFLLIFFVGGNYYDIQHQSLRRWNCNSTNYMNNLVVAYRPHLSISILRKSQNYVCSSSSMRSTYIKQQQRRNNISRYSSNKNNMIDIEDVVDDPDFLDRKNNPKYKNYRLDSNYDNDFDTSAFIISKADDNGAQYSCVINYDTTVYNNGKVLALPYMSRYDSDSTWITYSDNDNDVVQPAGYYGQIKEELAYILKDPRIEVTIAISVLLSCLLVAISTFDFIPLQYQNWLLYVEDGITVIFALDFFGRWISSNKDFTKHVLNLQFAIDVVVVVIPLLFAILLPSIDPEILLSIPKELTSPSALINLELLRVLRLRRVFQDMTTYTKFERALGIRNSGIQVWQLQLARVLFSLFTLLSISTGLIYTAEHDVNPTIPNYFTALYFSISTLATLGLGDITPITWQGRLVVCGTIIVGVAIVPAQAAALVEALVLRKDSKKERNSNNNTQQQPTMLPSTISSTLSDEKVNRSSLVTSGNVETNDGNSINNNGRIVLELETTLQCNNCNATMHWSSAQYCWCCGTQLSLSKKSLS